MLDLAGKGSLDLVNFFSYFTIQSNLIGVAVFLVGAARWRAYPLVWTGYVLVRGAIVGKYPYPFLDPANGGYGMVAVYVVAILVFGTLLCAACAWVGTQLGGRRALGSDAARAVTH